MIPERRSGMIRDAIRESVKGPLPEESERFIICTRGLIIKCITCLITDWLIKFRTFT